MTAEAPLSERADGHRWYHTIDLGEGVTTRGMVDTRAVAKRIPIPASLAGKRCLDVGTQNGFWMFELEGRGAESVVGIDIDEESEGDWPPGLRLRDPSGSYLRDDDRARAKAAFELARDAIGSQAQRQALNVYDLSPEAVGTFDFVFFGSLLLHLRDPVMALARARSVCTGEAVLLEAVHPSALLRAPRRPAALLDGTRNWWWLPNPAGLVRMAESAGFDVLERTGLMLVPPGPGFRQRDPRKLLRAGPIGAFALVKGFPHVALRLKPAA